MSSDRNAMLRPTQGVKIHLMVESRRFNLVYIVRKLGNDCGRSGREKKQVNPPLLYFAAPIDFNTAFVCASFKPHTPFRIQTRQRTTIKFVCVPRTGNGHCHPADELPAKLHLRARKVKGS